MPTRLILFFLLPSLAFAGEADTVLRQVYGAISTPCTQDSDADTFTTTVDVDSPSGDPTLKLTSTTDLTTGDVLVVNPGGSFEEVCIVDSVVAGDSVECTSNLVYTHTGADAHVVDLTNRLPATGLGLTPNRRYLLYCHDGAGGSASCECTQGQSAVDSLNTVGPIFMATEKLVVFVPSNKRFVSCTPADNSKIDICPLD